MTIEIRYQRKSQPGVNSDGHLFGRAIPYNSWTTIGDPKKWGFREKVNPAAARKSVNDGDIVLLDNHDTRLPLARKSAGTLVLRNGGTSLDWDASTPDTSYAHDVQANVRAKNYGGCSFGFEVIRDKWTDDKGNPADAATGTHREIMEMKLHEISICTFPAYGDTAVDSRTQIRSARGADPAELERSRRGMSDTGIDLLQNSQHDAWDPDGDGDDDGNYSTDDKDGDSLKPDTENGRSSRDAQKPYGDVAYADPGYQPDKKKRYPVDTKEHAKAAWAYVNKAKNAAKYTAQQLASIKSKIKAALKKFGVDSSDSSDESKMAEWESLADFREMTQGWDSVEFDGDEFGVLPDRFVSTDDANQLARDIYGAYTAQMRMNCVERAVDLNLPEMIPAHWGPDGQVGADKSEEVVRDMDAIYTTALSQPPTQDMLDILDRAAPYLSNETRADATKKLQQEAEEERQTLLPKRTLKDAKEALEALQRHRRTLDR